MQGPSDDYLNDWYQSLEGYSGVTENLSFADLVRRFHTCENLEDEDAVEIIHKDKNGAIFIKERWHPYVTSKIAVEEIPTNFEDSVLGDFHQIIAKFFTQTLNIEYDVMYDLSFGKMKLDICTLARESGKQFMLHCRGGDGGFFVRCDLNTGCCSTLRRHDGELNFNILE